MRFLRNRPFIITVVLVVVLIIVIASTGIGTALADGVGAVGSVLVPVQEVLYDAAGGIADITGQTPDASGAASPAATTIDPYATPSPTASLSFGTMPETEASATGALLGYAELVAENERLRAMLEYKENNVTQELKVARITGKEPGNWFEVFTINLGANDGIAVGMPVVTPTGLVGRVDEVSLSSAKIVTIIDARSSVSAIMERTRDTGVVKGNIGADDLTATLTMNYLPLDTDIIEGDVVLTSGYDEVYPKGLEIGTVTSSTDQSGGKLVSVEPSVDFRRLEEVMVVIRTEESGEQVVEEGSASPQVSYSAEAQGSVEMDPEASAAASAPVQTGSATSTVSGTQSGSITETSASPTPYVAGANLPPEPTQTPSPTGAQP